VYHSIISVFEVIHHNYTTLQISSLLILNFLLALDYLDLFMVLLIYYVTQLLCLTSIQQIVFIFPWE